MDRSKWEYKKLGEVATFINGDRGVNYPSQTDFVEVGIPFVNAGHLTNNKIDFSSMNYIKREKFDKLGSGKIKKGDILFCLRGSLGKKAIADNLEEGAIASSLVIIRPSKLNTYFLSYYLESPSIKREIRRSNNGSSQPNLSAKSVSQFVVAVPSITDQQRIVAELDCLNEMIAVKKEQLKEFDKLAQSIFYNMFGDPKINDRDWNVKKLEEVGDIINGSTPSTSDMSNWDGNVNWVTPAELGKQLYYGETSRKITEKGAKGLKLMPPGTVLLSTRAPIGKLAITTLPMCCNQGFKNIICTECINNVFLYFYLLLTMSKIEALGRGATFKEVSKKAISSYKVPLPPLALQQQFAEKISAIEAQKELVKQSIAETQHLLNYTMDKYFG